MIGATSLARSVILPSKRNTGIAENAQPRPIEEVMTALGCADQKAGKLLHELENKCRLIERKRQGLGKPNLIYVKNFVNKAADNPVDNTSGSSTPSPESRFQNRENHDSGAVKITDQESLKSRSNNTDKNDTDFSDTDSFPFTSFRRDHGREAKGNEAALRERYRELMVRVQHIGKWRSSTHR